MTDLTTDYEKQFLSQLNEINKLEATPKLVRDLAVRTLQNAAKEPMSNTAKQILTNGVATLSNISSGSIAENFKIIYSQMCILAVSNMEALLKKYFANAANVYTNLDADNPRLDQLKVTLSEVIANELRFGGKIGDLILEKDKPSFQDLKSIKETFEAYFNKKIALPDVQEKQVCFYLECRHILVHKGGIVDKKFMKSTSVIGANIKSYKEGDPVVITGNDWKDIKSSFTVLVKEVTKQSK